MKSLFTRLMLKELLSVFIVRKALSRRIAFIDPFLVQLDLDFSPMLRKNVMFAVFFTIAIITLTDSAYSQTANTDIMQLIYYDNKTDNIIYGKKLDLQIKDDFTRQLIRLQTGMDFEYTDIKIAPFRIDKYEVSIEDYRMFILDLANKIVEGEIEASLRNIRAVNPIVDLFYEEIIDSDTAANGNGVKYFPRTKVETATTDSIIKYEDNTIYFILDSLDANRINEIIIGDLDQDLKGTNRTDICYFLRDLTNVLNKDSTLKSLTLENKKYLKLLFYLLPYCDIAYGDDFFNHFYKTDISN